MTTTPNLLALDLVNLRYSTAGDLAMRQHLGATLIDLPADETPQFILETIASLATLAAGLLDGLDTAGVDVTQSLSMATIEATMELDDPKAEP